MTKPATSPAAASVTLRVAEARVEDAGRAIARMADADLVRIGARPGDIVKITGRTTTVARVAAAEDDGSACGPHEETGVPNAAAALGWRTPARSLAGGFTQTRGAPPPRAAAPRLRAPRRLKAVAPRRSLACRVVHSRA